MDVGKKLWLVIIIKLVIMFLSSSCSLCPTCSVRKLRVAVRPIILAVE